MVVGGLIAIPAGYLVIKMMQTERVSLTMVVFCSILMLFTTQYLATIDYIGAVIIIIGVGWIIYKTYLASEETVTSV